MIEHLHALSRFSPIEESDGLESLSPLGEENRGGPQWMPAAVRKSSTHPQESIRVQIEEEHHPESD
jgi:hypothetical protein